MGTSLLEEVIFKTKSNVSVKQTERRMDGHSHEKILLGYFFMLAKVANKAKSAQHVPFKLTE